METGEMKILITGGSGQLGSALLKIDPTLIAPSHDTMDILDSQAIGQILDQEKPDAVIHGAAFISPIRCQEEPMKAMNVNIHGTANMVQNCHARNIRLVYISTDYVYKGDRGLYHEEDELLPQNLYAWSKLGGECAVKMYQNSLIIRTSFCPDIFPYDKAYVDQFTSRDSLSIIANMILSLAKKPGLVGVINVGTERKSIKDLALKLGKKDVQDLSLQNAEFNIPRPRDTSFDLVKLKKMLNKMT